MSDNPEAKADAAQKALNRILDDNQLIRQRRAKAQDLVEQGYSLFPNTFRPGTP